MDENEPDVGPDDDTKVMDAPSFDPDASYSPRITLETQAVDERRGSDRKAYHVGVYFGDSPEEDSLGISGDISRGGLFVATDDPPKPGTMVELDFLLPHSDETITVLAEVRWRRQEWDTEEGVAPGFGVQFRDLAPDERRQINELLDRLDGLIA